jgi:dipeptidase
MISYAEQSNITVHYGEHGKIDFGKTFSNGEYSHKYYSGRRIWRALSIFAPN